MSRQLKQAASTATLRQDRSDVAEVVAGVIEDVRERGDDAVRHYSEKFDNWSPESFRLGPEEIDRIVATVPDEVLDDLRTVQANVRAFAQHQLESMREFEVETQPGVFLGQKHLPIAATGAYIPGGRYPLTASAHMTVVTAKVAGVERVTACTPPIRGEIPGATIAAMHLAGADEIFLLGGVQAVAAMSVGTQTIGKVDLLAGPGQRLRGGGEAPAVRRGGDRPVRGPHRDPRRRRRQRRSLRRRGRPAQPGRARTGLPGGAHHHVRGRSPGRPWRTSTGCCPRCRPTTWPVPPGATTGRCTSSTTWTRRTGWPTASPASTCRSSPSSPARRWRRCATTARSSSARAPACPTATSASAPTTCCRPAAPRGTPAGSGSGSTCARSPTRRSRTGPRARPSVSSAGARRASSSSRDMPGPATSGPRSTPAPHCPGPPEVYAPAR